MRNMLRKERKQNHIKLLFKTTKGKKEQKTKIRTKNKGNKQRTVTNMADSIPTISIITLNVNGLNAPIKRQTLSEWIRKQDQLYAVCKKPTLNIKTHIG